MNSQLSEIQSVTLKEINLEYSLEELMLKLKLQYLELQYSLELMQRADLLEKTLILGNIEDQRIKRWQRIRWLDSITDSMDMNLSNSERWWRKPGLLQSMRLQRVGHDLATERQEGGASWASWHTLGSLPSVILAQKKSAFPSNPVSTRWNEVVPSEH